MPANTFSLDPDSLRAENRSLASEVRKTNFFAQNCCSAAQSIWRRRKKAIDSPGNAFCLLLLLPPLCLGAG